MANITARISLDSCGKQAPCLSNMQTRVKTGKGNDDVGSLFTGRSNLHAVAASKDVPNLPLVECPKVQSNAVTAPNRSFQPNPN